MNQTNKKYNVLTVVTGFDIVSTVSVEGPDIGHDVIRQVIRTQDEHVRKGLIELGWTPPADPEKWRDKYQKASGRCTRTGQTPPKPLKEI